MDDSATSLGFDYSVAVMRGHSLDQLGLQRFACPGSQELTILVHVLFAVSASIGSRPMLTILYTQRPVLIAMAVPETEVWRLTEGSPCYFVLASQVFTSFVSASWAFLAAVGILTRVDT